MGKALIPSSLVFLFIQTFILAQFGGADHPPSFRVGVETVLLRVTVMDPLSRYVVGLDSEHFRVFEDKVEQTITHFSNDKAPVSVGIILDSSGSMSSRFLSARTSVVHFVQQGDPGDEYFLVTFNDQSRLVLDFTPRGEDIQNQASFANPRGRTALYDAVYLGLEKMKSARNDKKALIVITDGEDNSSRYTFSEVKDYVRESDTQIYVIGERGEMGYGRGIISEIVRLTGGRAFFPNNFKQLDYFVDLIHTELKNQYLLGYIPSDREFNGEWRRLQVDLEPPEGLPRLSVRTREGYLAPKQ